MTCSGSYRGLVGQSFSLSKLGMGTRQLPGKESVISMQESVFIIPGKRRSTTSCLAETGKQELVEGW